MPQVDQFIEFMTKKRGERFVIRNNENPQLIIGNQAKPVTTSMMNVVQVQSLVREIVPLEHAKTLDSGGTFSFVYSSPMGERQIVVEQTGDSIQVTIASIAEKVSIAPVAAPVAEEVQPVSSPVVSPADTPPTVAVSQEREARQIPHVDELFQYLKEHMCSDLYLVSNHPPRVRQAGELRELTEYEPLSPESLKTMLWGICPERNREQWETEQVTVFGYDWAREARLRCCYFTDRHGIGAVFRLIPEDAPTAEELGLPQKVLEVCKLPEGLILVTGGTASGKSTTLAALVHHVNCVSAGHIVAIEDPIEFVHGSRNSLVSQRELHTHTESFAQALQAAVLGNPDIVVVGEIRTPEMIAFSLETAQAGHLVLTTFRASGVVRAVDHIVHQFPPEQRDHIRVMLSESLVAVVAQTLCTKEGGGCIAAFEVLLCDTAVRNLIREDKTFQLPAIMQVGRERGMVTLNDSLCQLVKNNLVQPSEAYRKAIDKAALLRILHKEGIPYQPDAGHAADL